MSRGVDLSTITKAERVVLSVGILTFVNALIPYWYRIQTPRETFVHNGGLYGYGLAAALAGFTSAVIVIVRHFRTPAMFRDNAIHVMTGLIAVGALAAQATRTDPLWIGYWVETVLAAGLVAAGLLRVRERNRGWV